MASPACLVRLVGTQVGLLLRPVDSHLVGNMLAYSDPHSTVAADFEVHLVREHHIEVVVVVGLVVASHQGIGVDSRLPDAVVVHSKGVVVVAAFACEVGSRDSLVVVGFVDKVCHIVGVLVGGNGLGVVLGSESDQLESFHAAFDLVDASTQLHTAQPCAEEASSVPS